MYSRQGLANSCELTDYHARIFRLSQELLHCQKFQRLLKFNQITLINLTRQSPSLRQVIRRTFDLAQRAHLSALEAPSNLMKMTSPKSVLILCSSSLISSMSFLNNSCYLTYSTVVFIGTACYTNITYFLLLGLSLRKL